MTTQIRALDVQLTPQQAMAFAFHGFPEPQVQIVGRDFHAFTVKETPRGFEWAEFMARDPMIAVQQLANEISRNRQARA